MSTNSFTLTEYLDKIEIESRNTEFKTTILKSKTDNTVKPSSFPLFGIYGAITLSRGSYLICVTEAESVGVYNEELVYEIKKVKIVKYKNNPEENKNFIKQIFEEKNDAYEIGVLLKFFTFRGSYFSEGNIYKSSFLKEKDSFIFNQALINNLKKVTDDWSEISLKCIFGSFGFTNVNGVNVLVISRRSRHRNGVRLFSKGSDLNGFVSNFVETEQILDYEGKQNVFVQIRGSIPLKWMNQVNLKYDPPYLIEENKNFFKNSEKKLKKNYKRIFYLNLTRDIGYEKRIYSAFDKELKENHCEYLHFDLKKEIKKKKENTFKILEEKMRNFLEEIGYFSENSTQNGVVRTNCIDSTDRTNVSQFVLARFVLKNQLSKLNLEFTPELDKALKHLWLVSGDILSLQYTGTITSLGPLVLKEKSNFIGLIKEGYVSLKRYFINRFLHGSYHNAYLLINGKKNSLEVKPKEILRKNFGLFLLIFVFVTLFKYCFNKFKDVSEQNISFSISIIFIFYLIYTADSYFDIPDYD